MQGLYMVDMLAIMQRMISRVPIVHPLCNLCNPCFVHVPIQQGHMHTSTHSYGWILSFDSYLTWSPRKLMWYITAMNSTLCKDDLSLHTCRKLNTFFLGIWLAAKDDKSVLQRIMRHSEIFLWPLCACYLLIYP